ncbi:MAG: PASTA domain-containing protein [Monoglobales bacterium]
MKRLCMGCMREYDDQYQICPYCGYVYGTAAEQPYHIEPGTILINRYIVGKVLGFGGFGVTYIGWDYVMGRRIAIKEYLPSEFATRMPMQTQVSVYSGDREKQFEEGLEKTFHEAKRLGQLEGVDAVVDIYDFFKANGTAYIIMEYLEGISLKEYLEKHGSMTAEQALPVILQIGSAMEVIHQTGMLHRDIAPDNIYVLNPEEPGRLKVKLLDFGAARYATTKYSKSLSVIIKPGYAPVEQYRSRGDQGPWTDVYALAATFYKMLTGLTPEDAMERSVSDHLKKPTKLGCRIPKSMETALMNALNVRIQDRTGSMKTFMEELQQKTEVEARQSTIKPEDVGKIPKKERFILGVFGAAALIFAVLIGSGVLQPGIRQDQSRLEWGMTRVPNVINMNIDQAQSRLEEESLELLLDRAVYSREIPENRVYYQAVKEGTTVSKDSALLVWVSKGVEMGIFPAVTGLSQEEAGLKLKAKGFEHIRIEESREQGLYHTVLRTSEESGTQVALDKEITLVVCVNEESLQKKEGDLSDVPDVRNISRDEAVKILQDAGFQVNLTEEFDENIAEGLIMEQDIPAGTKAERGSYITLICSKGKENIYMPNVMLMTEEEASSTILQLGLKIGKITRQHSDTIDEGKVITQSISANTPVNRGDTVYLTVSLGKAPIEKPVSEEGSGTDRLKAAEEARRQAAEQEAARQRAAAEEAARQQAEAEAAALQSRREAEAALAEEKRRAEEEKQQQSGSSSVVVAGQSQNAQPSHPAPDETEAGSEGGSTVISASGSRTTSNHIEVGDYVGMPQNAAILQIQADHLEVGNIMESYSDEFPSGYVMGQSPESGDMVKKGKRIRLIISKGPEAGGEGAQ